MIKGPLMMRRGKAILPFVVEPGDTLTLDMETHCFMALYGDGRIKYFSSYARARRDVELLGNAFGRVLDISKKASHAC